MRKPGVLGGLAAAALWAALGCRPLDTWSSRVEDPGLQPLAPDVLLRQQADFRLYDPHLRKEFFLYLYEDDSIRQEVITVIDHSIPEGQRRPRMVSAEEHEYAMGIFTEDWKSRGHQERLRYFNEKSKNEEWRKRSLYDQQIDFKRREVEDLQDLRDTLEADLKSRQASGAYAGGDEKFKLNDTATVQRDLTAAQRRLLLSQGQLLILEYLRAQRDAQYARHSLEMVERQIPVKDLQPMYSSLDRLVDEIRMKVQPTAWTRPGASIRVDEGVLEIAQTRDVLVGVTDYLNRLRSDFAAQRRQ
jgi:hypothetical protein